MNCGFNIRQFYKTRFGRGEILEVIFFFFFGKDDCSLLLEDMTRCRMGESQWDIIVWQCGYTVSGI